MSVKETLIYIRECVSLGRILTKHQNFVLCIGFIIGSHFCMPPDLKFKNSSFAQKGLN